MKVFRCWCKVHPEAEWPNDKESCSIQDIKKGDHFAFADTSPSPGMDCLNQWHYGIATKDAYQREDGKWVVEAEDVRPPVLEIS